MRDYQLAVPVDMAGGRSMIAGGVTVIASGEIQSRGRREQNRNNRHAPASIRAALYTHSGVGVIFGVSTDRLDLSRSK